MPDNENSKLPITPDDRRLDVARKPQTKMARAIVASVPIVGPAASLLLETHISDQQSDMTGRYIRQLQERSNLQDERLDQISNEVFILGAKLSRNSNERWKPDLLASIVTKTEIDEATQLILMEYVASLNDYDMVQFLITAEHKPNPNSAVATLYEVVHQRSENAISEMVRDASLQRLERFALLAKSEKSGASYRFPTAVGHALLEIIG